LKGHGFSRGARGLVRNKNASSTKQRVVMEFYGLPPIGQKQRRPMDGAQFHSRWVGNAGGELKWTGALEAAEKGLDLILVRSGLLQGLKPTLILRHLRHD
jgi:hypothetical protein